MLVNDYWKGMHFLDVCLYYRSSWLEEDYKVSEAKASFLRSTSYPTLLEIKNMRGILYVLRAAIVQPMFSTKREYWKKDSISI